MRVLSVTEQNCSLRNYSSPPGIRLNFFLGSKDYSKNE